MAFPYYALASIAALILLAQLLLSRRGNKPPPFPPGPPTLPVLGNLHQLPLTKPYLAWTEWARTHGAASDGLLGLRLGASKRMLVLSRWQHVRDLLEGRGAAYSGRPYFPLAEHVVPAAPPGADSLHLAFMGYGAPWRRLRRSLLAGFLRDAEVDGLLPLQDAEGTQLVRELMADGDQGGGGGTGPESTHRRVVRYFGAVVLAAAYGLRGKGGGPMSRVGRFFAAQDEFAGLMDPGATPPVDVFPFLRYVPDALTPWRGWRRRAELLRQRQGGLYREFLADAERRFRAGKSPDCFFARLLRDQEAAAEGGRGKSGEAPYTRLQLEYIGGFLMEGGADTTATALEVFILAMATHPEVQRQAQEEVDRVFGTDALPGLRAADSSQLPFLKACFLETLRWRPSFPMGVPHATTADNTYRGYFIPKGTTVIANTWAIHHDPDEYDEPDAFRPSRYLDDRLGLKKKKEEEKGRSETAPGANAPLPPSLDHDGDGSDSEAQVGGGQGSERRKQTYAFGAGRRMCAGKRMAENSMMVTMSKLVWAFDVLPLGGRPLDTDVRTAFKDAILTGPKELDVRFVVRGDRRRDIILAEWERADAFLHQYE